MAQIGSAVVSLEGQDVTLSKELKAGDAKIKAFADRNKHGLFGAMKQGAGRGSELDETMRMLQGGGAVLGITAVASALEKTTAKMLEMQKQFQSGSVSVGEFVMEIGRSIPVIGGFVSAGANIREMITGEQEFINATLASVTHAEELTKFIKGIAEAKKAWEEFKRDHVREARSDDMDPEDKAALDAERRDESLQKGRDELRAKRDALAAQRDAWNTKLATTPEGFDKGSLGLKGRTGWEVLHWTPKWVVNPEFTSLKDNIARAHIDIAKLDADINATAKPDYLDPVVLADLFRAGRDQSDAAARKYESDQEFKARKNEAFDETYNKFFDDLNEFNKTFDETLAEIEDGDNERRKKLHDSLRNPFEVFKDTMNELLSSGLNPEFMARGKAEAMEKLKAAMPRAELAKLPDATARMFSSFVPTVTTIKEDYAKQQTDLQSKMATAADAILQKMNDGAKSVSLSELGI
jgi:hypothetical protein